MNSNSPDGNISPLSGASKDTSLPSTAGMPESSLSPEDIRYSKSEQEDQEVYPVDRYGFFLENPAPPADEALQLKRTAKWNAMVNNWSVVSTRRRKLLKKRIRKGVPDGERHTVWPILCGVQAYKEKQPGAYRRCLLEAVSTETNQSRSFRLIQETIERDIHRTFPKHSLFFDAKSSPYEPSPDPQDFEENVCGANEISSMIRQLQLDQEVTDADIMSNVGGQWSLRRVLKAYSVYDREVGYCQGLNFLSATFLTIVPEEDAFWMLVRKYAFYIVESCADLVLYRHYEA